MRGAVASRPRMAAPLAAVALVAGSAVFVLAVRAWGNSILAGGTNIRTLSPPVVGTDEWRVSFRLLAPVLVGGALVAGLPGAAGRTPWRQLLFLAFGAVAVWAVSLALVDGWRGLTAPVQWPTDEYLVDVPRIGDPLEFLRTFTARIDDYVTHVRGHPPGFVLLLWGLDRIGLGGPGWTAAVMVGGGAAFAPAALLTAREVAGERFARRAVPFLCVAPAALWIASTADALFAGLCAWSTLAIVRATRAEGRRADGLAALGGLGFGAALLCSYGLVLAGVVPATVAVARRRVGPLAVAAVASLAVLGAVALLGFNWWDGLHATRREYAESVASIRPYGYFFFSNVAAGLLVVGPAIVVGVARLRDRTAWLLVGGALGAMLAANLSGLSKGEVERIWLPFSLWVLLAGAALWDGTAATAGRARGWLALQAGGTILYSAAVLTRW